MVKQLLTLAFVFSVSGVTVAAPAEADYYRLITLPIPESMVLEVGGLLQLSDQRIMVATRRGEIFIVENAFSDPPQPVFKRWTFGLSQPLGLAEKDGWIYTAQRGELTRMKDSDGDDVADRFETVCDDWEISGNYHEYAFGPRLDKDGYFWITLNKPFGGEPYGKAHWRGWAVRVNPKTGKMHPMCVGLRSPAGVEVSPWGDVFYTDNQGEWCNSSKMSHLEFGDFHGHPHGLHTTKLEAATIKEPTKVPSGKYMKDLRKEGIKNFKMPTLWLPYNKMGKSPSGMQWDTSNGKFGPFHGQCFIADQSNSLVMRGFLEKVNGHWQGAAFPWREGFSCGLIRIEFATDPKLKAPSMFGGGSNRGWGTRGGKPWNLERLVWTGKVPFEVHEMSARSNGFVLTFTKPVDRAAAGDVASYSLNTYTYKLESRYGGPEADKQNGTIKATKVSSDGMSVQLVIDGMREGYVHELHMKGVKEAKGDALLHSAAYYTLVHLPKAGQVPVKPSVK